MFSKTISSLTLQNSSDNTTYLDTVGDTQESTWSVKVYIGSHETLFKIDTGAEVTAISEKQYKNVSPPILQKPGKILNGPGQHYLQVLKQFDEMLSHGQKSSLQQIFVIKDLKSNLLGLPAITALNLAPRLDHTHTSLVEDSFPTVFNGLGDLDEPYTIKLKDDAVPYALFTP